MAELNDSKKLLADFKEKYRHSADASANLEQVLELADVLQGIVRDIETKIPDFKYVDRLLQD